MIALDQLRVHAGGFSLDGVSLHVAEGEVLAILGNLNVTPDAYRQRGFSGLVEVPVAERAAGADAADAFEQATEGRFAAVAELLGNTRHGLLPIAQELFCHADAPLRDVLHRRHLHQLGEAFGKRGARHAGQ